MKKSEALTAPVARTIRPTWLATQYGAVCGGERARDLFASVACGVYPVLVARGCELPIAVVVDLASLFTHGADEWLKPPPHTPASAAALAHYCDLVNSLAGSGPLRRMIQEAHRRAALPARSSKGGKRSVRKGELDTPGLLVFLEVALPLFGQAAKEFLSDNERADWWNIQPLDHTAVAGAVKTGMRFGYDAEAQNHLQRFFGALVECKGEPPAEAGVRLTVAGARTTDGARALDLALFQQCLDYKLLELPEKLASRYLYLRRSMTPRRDDRQRASEPKMDDIRYGRAKVQDVLKSAVARDEFPELWAMGQVPSYRRYALRTEPRRVLLGWVVERSRAMRVRAEGGARTIDSHQLESVSRLIEDSIRYFRGLSGVDLRIAVLLHDGNGKARYLEPGPVDMERAPETESDAQAWLTDVPGFLPHYFLRVPVWPGDAEDPAESNGNGRRSRNPLEMGVNRLQRPDLQWSERAMLALAALATRGLASYDEGATLDLCHITVVGKSDSVPDEGRCDRTLRALSAFSPRPALTVLSCGPDGQQWMAWRPASGELKQTAERRYNGSPQELRLAFWGEVEDRLRHL
jgi:hypothetical protein